MEKDCSNEATTIVDRTSRAMTNKDMRNTRPKLHGHDDSDDEAETKQTKF